MGALKTQMAAASCPGCSAEISQTAGKGRPRKWCSRACRQKIRDQARPPRPWAPRKPRQCQICGSAYTPTYHEQRTCGRACGAELRRREGSYDHEDRRGGPSCPVYHRNCAHCGKLFIARYASRKACSDTCARRRLIGQVLDRHYGYVANGMREGPLLDYLKVRDRGRCGICRRPVRARSGPRRPSIDHIVPRSKGGSNDLANLQLAHLDCNLSKNNRGHGEQLLLIG